MVIFIIYFLLQTSKSAIHRFCLPMPFRFRRDKGHDLAYDVSAEVIKNCDKYIFVGRCLLILLTRQFLILWTMFSGSVFRIFWIVWFFPRKYKYRCIRVYVWFKDDKHVIWMWIWLILKNISLLDRIWSLWLFRFAHSPPNYIFWLGRLIFSVSINSHPDNIYISYCSWKYSSILVQ
jgi:hypothetical protein